MRLYWGLFPLLLGLAACNPDLTQVDTASSKSTASKVTVSEDTTVSNETIDQSDASSSSNTNTPRSSEFTTDGKPTKTIETPWGTREVYDPSQIPKDSPLIFDATLERVHTYLSKLEVCETKKVLDDRKSCVEKIQSSHAELWDNGRSPTIKIFSNYQDSPFAGYVASDFKWDIPLTGLLRSFSLGSGRALFPKDIHDDLLTSYLQHHAQNNGIEIVDLDIESDLPRPKFKGKSLDLLYKNFPEFKWAEGLPEDYASPYSATGHAFSMIQGKDPLIDEVWVTNYKAKKCRPHRSYFFKFYVVYKSPWVKDYLGNRDVAYLYLCSAQLGGVPRAVIFKLDNI